MGMGFENFEVGFGKKNELGNGIGTPLPPSLYIHSIYGSVSVEFYWYIKNWWMKSVSYARLHNCFVMLKVYLHSSGLIFIFRSYKLFISEAAWLSGQGARFACGMFRVQIPLWPLSGFILGDCWVILTTLCK